MFYKIVVIFIFIVLFFGLINKVIAQQIPVVENKSIIVAKVQCVILKNIENPELVLQILESKGVEGYRNLAKVGDLILAVPFKYLKKEDINLIQTLRPGDLVEGEIEFVGDEYGRKWIIRSIEKYLDNNLLKDVIKSFLISKRYLKKDQDFSYEINKLDDKIHIIIKLDGSKILTLIMNKDLVIIDYF